MKLVLEQGVPLATNVKVEIKYLLPNYQFKVRFSMNEAPRYPNNAFRNGTCVLMLFISFRSIGLNERYNINL